MLTRIARLVKNSWPNHLGNQSGDTIIEVMIVLAVLGLAIGISYATANRSLLDTRQAQENSQATELVQSQVEQLRTQTSNADTTSANYIYKTSPMFCMNSGSVVKENSLNPSNPTTLDPDSGDYVASCIVNTYYHLSIQYSTAGDTFTVKAVWDDVLGKGTDSVTNTYRLHLVADSSSATGLCKAGYIGTPPNCTPAPSPPSPFLAASGCSGPVGVTWSGDACLSGDKITVTVSGVNSGDTCTLRNDQGSGSGTWSKTLSTSGSSCSGSFSFSSLDPSGSGNQTAYLTAYVTDSGNTYKSNWTSFQSWSNTPTHLSCSWNDPPGGPYAHDGYSNWVMTINSDPCPSGTTCYAPAGYCTTYGGSDPESYADDIACQVGGYYVYGATWDGTDYDGTPCPPGTTQVSSIDRAPPGPPGTVALAVIQSAAYADASCKLARGSSSCD